ncbi:MAG: dihydrofolate reductase [Bacteroidetes bacterium]|nr:dihydrofolate reductase [Bacteroidota bacterium]
MTKNKLNLLLLAAAVITLSQQVIAQKTKPQVISVAGTVNPPFNVVADEFADIMVLRYQVPGFNELTTKQKELAYYLYEAALSGRDIIWDQKYRHNLKVRKTLEAIWKNHKGDRSSKDWKEFEVYTKRVWFSNGIHHHYASDKIMPGFSQAAFAGWIKEIPATTLPLAKGESPDQLIAFLNPVMFDANVDAKTVNLEAGIDNIKGSANNFYEGVTANEVEEYYASKRDENDQTPVSYGLNSKLMKVDGKIVEIPWKVGGMYGAAISKIVYWLEKASGVAENAEQKKALDLLIEFYKTGDLKKFDEYNIAWVADVNSTLDVVNGFIEVYQDALGKKGSFESVVSIKDFEATKKIQTIASNAQWFEDNAPLLPEHKKETVKGIIGKSINVIVESGDAAPSTPIGINLPNSNWIRQQHGSKSVALGNIVNAYNVASGKSPVTGEFALNDEVKNRIIKYGNLSSELHTDMHEVIGHASGKLEPGVATPDVTLKNYQNALEEARADLVALYYITDPKLVEIGVMPSVEVGYAEYDSYLMNGLMLQLNRVDLGKSLEEAHMRNRQLISKWVLEKGKADNVAELIKKDGKTYVRINDYAKLRTLFGDLLREIQRIKSKGDFEAGQALVENYGVKIDPALHKEIKERFSKLDVAPYKGFIQPKLTPVIQDGKFVDVKIEYPESFEKQMMEYAEKYSFLPVEN